MARMAVIYWSGTGNTEAMAQEVMQGAASAGAQAELFTVSDFSAEQCDNYDALAFGCPSMGAEQLEESEFEPLFTECESHLKGKKIALFGSYGWGDGEWMRSWEECLRMTALFAAVHRTRMPPSSAAHWEALWHKAANAEILVALAQKRALFQGLYSKVNKI